MSEALRVCAKGKRYRAGVSADRLWQPGQTLRVCFLEGDEEEKQKVREIAPQWTEYANLEFAFEERSVEDAHIRITFQAGTSWSAIGTDSLNPHRFPKTSASMNIGYAHQSVILHEFGHALGFVHEHQQPNSTIIWNQERVYQNAGKGWSKAKVYRHILSKYPRGRVISTAFDPASIMIYNVPKGWIRNNKDVVPIRDGTLSPLDKQLAGRVYLGKPVLLALGDELTYTAALSEPGEVDEYKLEITEGGKYRIETLGVEDMKMEIDANFDPDFDSKKDDDSGRGANARIVADFEPGDYLAKVWHNDEKKGVGAYRIHASRE